MLVAVTIGGLLIFGATKVYVDSRATYEVNETAARLQETARYALSVIEPDIRMSNYWGLVKGAGIVINQAAQDAASAGAPRAAATTSLTTCSAIWRRTTTRTPSVARPGSSRQDWNGGVFSSDTLTVRRASSTLSNGTTGRLRICSTRIFASLVTDSSACTAAPNGQVNDLVVNTYYVDRDSTHRCRSSFAAPAAH